MAGSAGDRPVALVTGAAGGLGGAIARALGQKGFDLVLNDLSESKALTGLCAELEKAGVAARPLAQDIARVEELDTFVERVHALFGRLDCLVNNAGVSVLARGDILEVSPESFDRCVAVNLRGQFFLTQRVAHRMLQDARPELSGGRRRSIITITTVAVEHVIGRVLAEYGIAKAGLSHMVKHFAVRLVTEGIDCYEVRPGMMATSMTESSRQKYDALIAQGFVPAGRWGEIEDIGRAVANLADGALSYAVGLTISIDGGMALKTF
ncbi:MAG TPA: 3-ketoacyl-ACP reductase [Paracoccaceae bacterium]|nr:3-ketoacyl-ACP reductase [Paracoccaceae bacterium]